MDEDFKLLISEYTRLASTSPSFTESPFIIPLLLRIGSFSPSRLDRWPFKEICTLLNSDSAYRAKFSSAFKELAVDPSSSPDSLAPFNLNEKKAVSFLLASKDFQAIHDSLADTINLNKRFFLACLEYSCLNSTLPEQMYGLDLPCLELEVLTPKFKAKYPLLTAMMTSPSIETAKLALDRLYSSPDPTSEPELIAILQTASRSIDPKLLHSEIIKPIWGTRNEKLAIVVLEAISICPELFLFCQEYLKDLK